jgi:hypothetical protein
MIRVFSKARASDVGIELRPSSQAGRSPQRVVEIRLNLGYLGYLGSISGIAGEFLRLLL